MIHEIDFKEYMKLLSSSLGNVDALIDEPISVKLHIPERFFKGLGNIATRSTSKKCTISLSLYKNTAGACICSNSIIFQIYASRMFKDLLTLTYSSEQLANSMYPDLRTYTQRGELMIRIDIPTVQSILTEYKTYIGIVNLLNTINRFNWKSYNIAFPPTDEYETPDIIFRELPLPIAWFTTIKTGFLAKAILNQSVEIEKFIDIAYIKKLEQTYLGSEKNYWDRLRRFFEALSGIKIKMNDDDSTTDSLRDAGRSRSTLGASMRSNITNAFNFPTIGVADTPRQVIPENVAVVGRAEPVPVATEIFGNIPPHASVRVEPTPITPDWDAFVAQQARRERRRR